MPLGVPSVPGPKPLPKQNFKALRNTFQLFCILLLSVRSFTQVADVIFTNGDIYTGGHFSTANTAFTATDGLRAKNIAVVGARVFAIGGDEVLSSKGAKTQVIDLGGRFVMPGF